MDGDVVIRVDGLSKRYSLGTQSSERYTALRDVIANSARRFLRRVACGADPEQPSESFWALKGVSFEVKRGEVVGIIGRNGAGKSTLLKVLSRITEPTEGRIMLCGRVASLLEVGTGFHPELTGRENIYLNGAILGMHRHEIKAKFDEIVAFAEVERFLDTPVKRYSSGMYVRLAFAVAAHLEPEILIVDEVLAVGDAEFQKKCLGKMEQVAHGGRTVIFVSHNMRAVTQLCGMGVWLEAGRLRQIGNVAEITSDYLGQGVHDEGERVWDAPEIAPGDTRIRLRAVRVLNASGQVSTRVDIRQPCSIELAYEVTVALANVRLALRLTTSEGEIAFTTAVGVDSVFASPGSLGKGSYVSRCKIPGDFLNEKIYRVTASADVPFVEILFVAEDVISFHVEQTGGVSGRYGERWPGAVCPDLPWTVERSPETVCR